MKLSDNNLYQIKKTSFNSNKNNLQDKNNVDPKDIFGDNLSQPNENIVNNLRDFYKKEKKKNYTYEKTKIPNENKWYLTIKNINESFRVTQYYNNVYKNNNYCKSYIKFGSDNIISNNNINNSTNIESEFYIKFKEKVSNYISPKRNKNIKINNLKIVDELNFTKDIKNFLKDFFQLIDGSFVINFFKDKVIYTIEMPRESKFIGLNLKINNFCDKICIDDLNDIIKFWCSSDPVNYQNKFQKGYYIQTKNRYIIVKLKFHYTKRNNTNEYNNYRPKKFTGPF